MTQDELFICECHNTEHQLIFSYFDDEDDEVYVSVHLIPEYRIWRRIINAIKYIFGHRSRYGHFDEFIFQKKDAPKLVKIAKHLDKNVLDNKPQEPENSPSLQGGERK